MTESSTSSDLGAPTTDAPATEATATETTAPAQTFADLGVEAPIVSALSKVGITAPFPIQAMTLPIALARHDIIGQAKTGTGKTLGFGIPLLQGIVGPGEEGWSELGAAAGKPQGLVIVPTRELAVQVAGDLATAGKERAVRVLQIYGGRAYEPQVAALEKGIEIVVGTPGRLLDLIKQRRLDLSHVKAVVLDEADEMLDLGFLPDVESIIGACPATRHTMLFSATMPGPVVAMARRYMTQPTHIRAQDPSDPGQTVTNVKQFAYRAHALDKIEVLARILQADGRGLTIVFARTKRTAAKIVEELTERGFAAGALHGDLGQGAREQALRAFRHGKIDVLIATDVAARGIDVDDVTHVINYQCPEDEKVYLHRIGRTARAGHAGTAVTFVDWEDMPRWGLIDRALDLGIPEPVETYSTSDHLFTDLGIPAGTKGRLPRSKQVREGLSAERLEDLGETGKRTSRGRSSRSTGASSRSSKPADRGGRSSTERPKEPREGRRTSERSAARSEGDGAPRRRRRTRGGVPVDQQRGSQATQGGNGGGAE